MITEERTVNLMSDSRYTAWRDQLMDGTARERADYVSSLPPEMSVAVVDHDLRGAIKDAEGRIIDEININRDIARGNRPISRKTIAVLAMVGGALVDTIGSVIHNLR
jgi:hypothetical protein